MAQGSEWHHCTTCRKPIHFGEPYFQCSVTTCNRPKTALFFCSVPCWDAHVPTMHHRDAWAEEAKAPSHEQWEKEQEGVSDADEPAPRRVVPAPDAPSRDAPRDVLVVVSKLKQYVRARSGMNTSDGIVLVLSDYLRRLCDGAIENAKASGRKTLLDRDFHPLVRPR
jgi:hypothetical protein